MQDAERTKEPYFRGLLGLPPRHIDMPFGIRNKYGYVDGQCELAIRKLEMPMIDHLAEETRYRLGAAMRRIAASFDQLYLERDEAINVVGDLFESIAQFMSDDNERATQFSVETMLELLLERHSYLYPGRGSFLRRQVHEYVQYMMNGNYEVAGPPRAWDLEEACKVMLEHAPVIYMASQVYDQCERADWTAYQSDGPMLPAPAFRIAIDGETWLQAENNPLIFQQTDWLIVDARELEWRCYERVRMKGMDIPPKADVTQAAWFDSTTGRYGPIESQTYLPIEGAYHALMCDQKSAGRMFHVVGSLVLLLQHPHVRLRDRAVGGSCTLELPEGATVDELIHDVLDMSPR